MATSAVFEERSTSFGSGLIRRHGASRGGWTGGRRSDLVLSSYKVAFLGASG